MMELTTILITKLESISSPHYLRLRKKSLINAGCKFPRYSILLFVRIVRAGISEQIRLVSTRFLQTQHAKRRGQSCNSVCYEFVLTFSGPFQQKCDDSTPERPERCGLALLTAATYAQCVVLADAAICQTVGKFNVSLR